MAEMFIFTQRCGSNMIRGSETRLVSAPDAWYGANQGVHDLLHRVPVVHDHHVVREVQRHKQL